MGLLVRKIDDFASTITDYEALIKMLEKLRTQAGATDRWVHHWFMWPKKTQVEADGGPPKQFVKAIGALEDYIEFLGEDEESISIPPYPSNLLRKTHGDIQDKKSKGNKLPENKAKAFNTLRSKAAGCCLFAAQPIKLPVAFQVKKGNKPYTDDLTQLRSNPEDFQSEEEAADSASEAGSNSWPV